MIETINFEDDNVGYEQIAQALQTLGLDWEHVRDHGLEAECSVILGTQDDPEVTDPQRAFDLPSSGTCSNGTPVTFAFPIYAGIYEGIKGTILNLRDQLKCPTMNLVTMTVRKHRMHFVVCKA